jgi:asparagine synthase (glutamine-hydrolysing)
MTLMRTLYLAARRKGARVLIDGAGGDTLLSEGHRIEHLLRSGAWRVAYREAAGRDRFWGGAYPPRKELTRGARAAFVPNRLLRELRPLRVRTTAHRRLRESLLNEEFARRVDLPDRLRRLAEYGVRTSPEVGYERALAIDHPYLAVGRERYDRIGGGVGVEPRDPFVDARVAELCVRLPDWCTLSDGWPKAILRVAAANYVPDSVRWRRGKEHLGWAFTTALMGTGPEIYQRAAAACAGRLQQYVRPDVAETLREAAIKNDPSGYEDAYHLIFLEWWLERHTLRPGTRHEGRWELT